MKRALDPPCKITEGLKHASNMVSQLRTSLLSPTNYYKLYVVIATELKFLEMHLLEEKAKGEKISRLYELVQYAGNILPRLYLLITVGSAYIKSKEAPAKEILHDLVEMTRGVQQPLRGLFLRYYLTEMTRDKLPDVGSLSEEDGGIEDSVDFVIQNFTEMNKMWVRMQPPKTMRAQRIKEREKDRMELRQVVEKNISILTQLDGVTPAVYANSVLTRLLEQVVSCQDRIAQEALMDSIVHAFPDEYHLRTLNVFIDTLGRLVGDVDVKAIVVSLFDRLTKFIRTNRANDLDLFSLIFDSVKQLIIGRPALKLAEILEMLVSLMELSLACNGCAHETMVDAILEFATSRLSTEYSDVVKCTDRAQVRQIHRLLMIPLETFQSIIQALHLPNYAPVMSFLNYANRKLIATDVAKTAIETGVAITDKEDVERVLNFIGPLVRDELDQPADEHLDPDDFEHDQNLLASVIHLFSHSSPAELFGLYLTARKIFIAGDPRQTRIRHTYVPLTFSILRLARRMRAEIFASDADPKDQTEMWIKRGRVLFRFVHESVTTLGSQMPDIALKLFLQAAQAASHAGFETIAYEFLTQAFMIYESEIYEAKNQSRTMQLLIGTLQTLRCFSPDNYDTLITKVALYSTKLLVRQDQCQSVLQCSHLFWVGDAETDYRDGKKVLECLQKALKTADLVTEPAANLSLFIEILNEYLYHFSHGNQTITVAFLNNLIELINTNIDSLKSSHELIDSYYRQTLQYIRSKQAKLEAWRAIKLA